MGAVDTNAIGVLVRRLARPHPSGGTVIERSVILAEGSDSAAIFSWISDHDGVEDSSSAATPSSGLHGARDQAQNLGPARRFVLPVGTFD
jgi:hypothetical protein